MPIVLAAPAIIVSAILALLFMLAWSQWQGVIVNTLSVDLPVIGNVLGRLVSESLEGAYLILVSWFDALLTPLAELILRPIAAVENTVGALKDLGAWTGSSVANLLTVNLPAYIAAVNGTLTSYFDIASTVFYDNLSFEIIQSNFVAGNIVNALTAEIGIAKQGLETEIAGLRARIDGGLVNTAQLVNLATNAAEGAIAGAINQAEQYTLDAYSAATAYASTLAQTVENDLAAGINAAETFATTADLAIGAVIATDLDNAITGALSGIWTDVESEVIELERVIGTDDAAILEAIKALPRELPGSIAAVAALAGVTTLTLTRYLRDCGIPNCKNLSQFGRDLQGLLAVVEDASFLDFIIGLIHNPSGAAGAVDDALGGSIRATTGTFKQLVGI